MPDIRTYFRHCPSCGRRFEIRLVKKEQEDSSELTENMEHPMNPIIARSLIPATSTLGPLTSTKSGAALLSNEAPSIVDIEDFRYTYECKHCGHEWSEVHETENTFDAPEGYTGD